MEVIQQDSRCHSLKGIPKAAALSFLLASFAMPVISQDTCTTLTVPGTSNFDISSVVNPAEDHSLPPDAVVGSIVYTRLPIFNAYDPKENNRLFQLADFLHIDTQERIVEDHLLFAESEPIDERLLEETARELRRAEFLYDARIWPYRICGNQVDIEVVTREVWTITGGFSFSRSGGSDEKSISLSDGNFLGRGELVSLAKTTSTDRDGFQVQYFDPSLMGSRYTLNLFHVDNDDGYLKQYEVALPFYSLDSRYAWGLELYEDKRSVDLYARGEEIAAFQAEEKNENFFVGFSEGWVSNSTERWYAGWRSHRERYSPDPDEPLPAVFPVNREYNYPFIGYQSIHEDFIKISNLNQIHRIEDFNLGQTWNARIGYASDSFGSDLDRIVYEANYRDAWRWEHRLLQWDFSIEGLWQTDAHDNEDVLIESQVRYYDGLDKVNGTLLSWDMQYSRNMPAHKQILLGAEEGLRGYPARYQDGDRRFVFSAEHRYFTDWHLFRLLRVGGAVFFDAGRAWFPETDNKGGTTGILGDVGFGLRIASSRAQTKRVLNIDIAFPLKKFDDVDSMQVLISSKQSF